MLMEFVEENSNNNSNFPGSPRDPVNFFDNSAGYKHKIAQAFLLLTP